MTCLRATHPPTRFAHENLGAKSALLLKAVACRSLGPRAHGVCDYFSIGMLLPASRLGPGLGRRWGEGKRPRAIMEFVEDIPIRARA